MSFSVMDLKKIHSVKDYNRRSELVDILCKYWEADLELKNTTYSTQYSKLNKELTSNKKDFKKFIKSINSQMFKKSISEQVNDYILKSPVDVVTVIDGCAASAATLMSVVGTHRMMHRHSFMLIHQLSSWLAGKYAEMQDDMKNNDLLMKTIKGVYEEHTKIPKSHLSKILKHDLWWDAKKCLSYGLVDEII